jgi:hypothetical protein
VEIDRDAMKVKFNEKLTSQVIREYILKTKIFNKGYIYDNTIKSKKVANKLLIEKTYVQPPPSKSASRRKESSIPIKIKSI